MTGEYIYGGMLRKPAEEILEKENRFYQEVKVTNPLTCF
jgi:hypothetical protein